MMFCKRFYVLFILCLNGTILLTYCKQNIRSNSVEEVSDVKDFKKLLRTKTNVLVLFSSSHKRSAPVLKTFSEAAEAIKGQGTMLMVDCGGDGKKLCKKLKVSPETYEIRHYKDGEFNKDYDRKESVQSIVNFMKDPTGDLPWEEEPTAVNVTHIPDAQSLERLLKKETRPVMVMFYAPWCGYCKRLKPDYAAAATEVKDFAVMAAIDVNRPENAAVRVKHNITGFPTLLYFRNGELKHIYEGENNKEKLVAFMKNPQKPQPKTRHAEWSLGNTHIKQLNSENFDSFIKSNPSVLVMFYAPWCGHCQRMKPEYEKAAEKMKHQNIKGVLAAVDATKETDLASKFQVSGYPSVKYFVNGSFAFDVPSVRVSEKLINFMKNPKKEAAVAEAEEKWSDQTSEVIHLTTENIKAHLKKKRHSLVMFYAPSNITEEMRPKL